MKQAAGLASMARMLKHYCTIRTAIERALTISWGRPRARFEQPWRRLASTPSPHKVDLGNASPLVPAWPARRWFNNDETKGAIMRLISAAALALLLQLMHLNAMAQSASTSSAPKSNLTRLLEAELSRLPARSGIYVKHLGTGEQASVRGNEEFESASTIKVAVMVLAFRLVDQKKLDLDERYVIKPADYRGGSGIFRYKDPGLNPTIRDVIMEMIITSDNTATDIMRWVAPCGRR